MSAATAAAAAPPGPPRTATAISLKPISCPSCGGATGTLMPGDVRECPYCGVPLTLVAAGVAGSAAIAPGVGYEAARRSVERFLSGPGTPEGLKEKVARRGIDLAYVPFFDMLLIEAAEEPPPLRARLSASRLTAVALEEGAAEIGADRIDPDRVRSTPAAPFDAVALSSRGIVLDPQRRPESIRLPRTLSEPVAIERRVKFVYYPVWLARYSYGRSLYAVSVDGVTGEILRGMAPASMKGRVLAGVGFTILFSVLASFAAANPRLLLETILRAAEMAALAAGGLVLVLAAAWDRLRFRRELLVEGAVRKQRPINRPEKTGLEKVASFLFNVALRRGRALPLGWWRR